MRTKLVHPGKPLSQDLYSQQVVPPQISPPTPLCPGSSPHTSLSVCHRPLDGRERGPCEPLTPGSPKIRWRHSAVGVLPFDASRHTAPKHGVINSWERGDVNRSSFLEMVVCWLCGPGLKLGVVLVNSY